VGSLVCRNRDTALIRVGERIAQLLDTGQVLPGQIAVLLGTGSASMALPDKLAGKPTCRSDEIRRDHIVVDTVRRFKGLSRPCVFLIGIEGLTDPDLIYVATSRANIMLELVGTAEDINRLRQEVVSNG
jgi:hypothetical protein